jgi:hypothetical protein
MPKLAKDKKDGSPSPEQPARAPSLRNRNKLEQEAAVAKAAAAANVPLLRSELIIPALDRVTDLPPPAAGKYGPAASSAAAVALPAQM